MENLSKEQRIQEEQYQFPYHYIPTYENGFFAQHLYWSWGYRYIAGIQLLLDKLRSIKFNSLIDIGCGDGRFLREVHRNFPNKELLGVDYSERAIALAKAMNPTLKFEKRNIIEEPIEGDFDVATLVEVLEHIPPDQVKQFLKGVATALRQGGLLLLTVPHANKVVPDKHYQHFTFLQLRDLLYPFFEVKESLFLDKKSKMFRLFNSLLCNNFFILNNKLLLRILFNYYKKHLFYTNEKNCGRIFVMCEKK